MQVLKKHVMNFLGSFQATQTAAVGTQECRNSLLFQYTCYHLCNSPTLSKADEPKLALLCMKFGIVNYTFMFLSFKKKKIHHAQVC